MIDEAEYSVSRAIRSVVAETWGRVKGLPEHEVHRELCDRHGHPDRNGIRVPDTALRDLTVAAATGGGYLAGGPSVLGYIESIQPHSVALKLGAQVVTVEPGKTVAIPRGTTAATPYWLAHEGQQTTETNLGFGQIGTTPKMLAAYVEVSRTILLQASNLEAVLRAELRRAAATAIDRAALQGSGASGEALGIVGTPGVGAFTGSTLGVTGLRNAQADIAGAVVDYSKIGFVTMPTIAETLGGRQRFTGSDRTVWEGQSYDGVAEGMRALSTTNCPTGYAVCGDWSSLWILQWTGQLVLEIDPFSKFTSGIVGVRLLLPCDIVIARPAAFSVASSVT